MRAIKLSGGLLLIPVSEEPIPGLMVDSMKLIDPKDPRYERELQGAKTVTPEEERRLLEWYGADPL